MIKKNKRHHFVGSIVNIAESVSTMGISKFIVIDGQQRITTMSLLMAALRDYLIAQGADPQITGNLTTQTLINAGYNDERQYKLLLTEEDRGVYNKIIDGNDVSSFTGAEKASNIYTNYLYFLKHIQNSELTPDQISDSVAKLEIVNIILDRAEGDDPQRIFESLNSTGMQLEKSDLIRNYMLMGISEEKQRHIYNAYWRPFEASFKGPDSEGRRQLIDDFFRYYIAVKTAKIPSKKDVYEAFKSYAEPRGSEGIEDLARDIYKFGQYFNNIINASTGLPKLDRKLNELATLQTNIPSLFFMPYLDYADSLGIEDQERTQVFDIVENYLARRIICNVPSGSLTKVFTTLHSEVIKIYDRAHTRGTLPANPYINILIHVLLRKEGHSYFPSDQDVRNDMLTRKVYRFNNPNKWFLLERMENLNSKETNDIVKHLREGNYSIEHIMPQTLNNSWKTALGSNYEQIHADYLHTFANLTITGYNSNYGNRPFHEKRDGYYDSDGNKIDGYVDSPFRLSADLVNRQQWDKTEILKRGQWLVQRFLKLWPMPTTSYIPMANDREEVGFDEIMEGMSMTYRKLTAFTFDGQTFEVRTWKKMLIRLCAMVYEKYPYQVKQLCADKSGLFCDENIEDVSKFADECYVYANTNTNSKIHTIDLMFDRCDIDRSCLTFSIIP